MGAGNWVNTGGVNIELDLNLAKQYNKPYSPPMNQLLQSQQNQAGFRPTVTSGKNMAPSKNVADFLVSTEPEIQSLSQRKDGVSRAT